MIRLLECELSNDTIPNVLNDRIEGLGGKVIRYNATATNSGFKCLFIYDVSEEHVNDVNAIVEELGGKVLISEEDIKHHPSGKKIIARCCGEKIGEQG